MSCSYDNTIKIYESDDDDWVLNNTLENFSDTIWDIDFDNDASFMVAVCNDGSISIWLL